MRRFLLVICVSVLGWIPLSALALGIAPASMDLAGERGQTVEGTIVVINSGNEEQTYYLGTMGFVPDATSGSPRFVSLDVDHSGLPDWISFPVPSVLVPARTRVEVPFRVAIPSDQPSGTYYGAVTVSATPSELVASNGASVDARVASLVFLTVEGETVESIALLDFTHPGDTDGPFGYAHSYAFRVQNQGNVSVVPVATITVRDLFGRTVWTQDANSEDGRVLPGTTRTFSGEINSEPSGFLAAARQQAAAFAIGPVTATLTVANEQGSASQSFGYLVIPWQLLVCLVVLLAPCAVIWKLLTKKTKKLQ